MLLFSSSFLTIVLSFFAVYFICLSFCLFSFLCCRSMHARCTIVDRAPPPPRCVRQAVWRLACRGATRRRRRCRVSRQFESTAHTTTAVARKKNNLKTYETFHVLKKNNIELELARVDFIFFFFFFFLLLNFFPTNNNFVLFSTKASEMPSIIKISGLHANQTNKRNSIQTLFSCPFMFSHRSA